MVTKECPRKKYFYKGYTRSLAEISRITGICYETLRTRLIRGWSTRLAFSTDKQAQESRLIEYRGIKLPIHAWAKRTTIPFSTLYRRVVVERLPLDVAFRPGRLRTTYKDLRG